MKNPVGIKTFFSSDEERHRARLLELFRSCPIPEEQLFNNLGLFLNSKDLARILFMDFLYRQIVSVHGVVMDLGTRWGQNMALFTALRGMYEPFNRHKKIIGFDTFRGFPSVSKKDGASDLMKKGNTATVKNYEVYLDDILKSFEGCNPLSHIKKYDIRMGDASKEVPEYLRENPETIVALAYFDFDIYAPTKECLKAIKPHLVKGSILAFDELNDHDSPGETVALKEVFGLNTIRLQRFPITSRVSYFVYEHEDR
ncbi:MAG: crotonobetainyl-CoA--carnitine CoA-transferase [Patescibacteria group bacterium]